MQKIQWAEQICHDCEAKVGELHELGCDVERCPICNGQLISCSEEHFKQVDQGDTTPRIPYFPRIVRCDLCNIPYPDFFMVPDEEWDKFIVPELQDKVICRPCYDTVKSLVPKGWRKEDL